MKWFVQVQSWDSYEALLSYEQGLLFEYLLNQFVWSCQNRLRLAFEIRKQHF